MTRKTRIRLGVAPRALAAMLACAAPAALPSIGHAADDAEELWTLLDEYCVSCHNFSDWAGAVAFDTMLPDEIHADAEVWEETIRRMRGGLMPPPGEPRPQQTEIAAFVSTLETTLDSSAETAPGYVDLHRLNRKEYANAVRDMLGVEVDVATLLPVDTSLHGFDNMASVLTVSPTFMEQYVGAARTVALTAIGDGASRPGSAIYVFDGGASTRRHIEGLPLGTRGGVSARHYFPADGEYRINIDNMAQALWVYNMEFENTVVVTLDGVPVYETVIGGEEDMRAIDQQGVSAADYINLRLKDISFQASSGPHDVAVAFLARTFAESDQLLELSSPGGGVDTLLNITSFEIRGPFGPQGLSASAPRARIFVCEPEQEADSRACAERILERQARLAYRRPVDAADMAPLMRFYDAGAAQEGPDAGVRQALTAILASPEFLYRYAAIPEDLAPGALYELNGLELASRLSFFLWSSIPDEELQQAALDGELSDQDGMRAQVARMLADPRANALVTGFAMQWLGMTSLDEVIPEPSLFPNAAGMNDPRIAYRKELELFIRSVVREDRPLHDLLTADWTYLNERTALLYGITDVRGDQFRRVTLTDPARFGLLGKGAVLMGTSYPNRTAPVLRGKFILDNIIGAPPSPPPAGVDTDLGESDPNAIPLTIRERLAQHSADPSCNSCHGVMDPLGLALENFNAVGEWRDRDLFAGERIDASGELPGGIKLNGPDDLREALTQDMSVFARTFTQELMTFALGRPLTHLDMPTVRSIVREAEKDDYRLSSIVLGIVSSEAFRMMQAPDSAPGGQENVQEAALQP